MKISENEKIKTSEDKRLEKLHSILKNLTNLKIKKNR